MKHFLYHWNKTPKIESIIHNAVPDVSGNINNREIDKTLDYIRCKGNQLLLHKVVILLSSYFSYSFSQFLIFCLIFYYKMALTEFFKN